MSPKENILRLLSGAQKSAGMAAFFERTSGLASSLSSPNCSLFGPGSLNLRTPLIWYGGLKRCNRSLFSKGSLGTSSKNYRSGETNVRNFLRCPSDFPVVPNWTVLCLRYPLLGVDLPHHQRLVSGRKSTLMTRCRHRWLKNFAAQRDLGTPFRQSQFPALMA